MSLHTQLEQLKGNFLDFLFPAHCLGCGREGEFLCASCRNSLPRCLPPLCVKCGRPLTLEQRCSNCYNWQMEIDGIRSPFRFEGIVRQAIHKFKYNNFKALGLTLSHLLAGYLEARPLPKEVLVPVPLHSHRLRERGYNQSSLLAQELGKLTAIPVVEGSLVRFKDTPSQARSATAESRRSNVAEAFACRDQRLQGERVLLIDDVCTTGATLNSCAIALKRVGATSVWGLTLAREV